MTNVQVKYLNPLELGAAPPMPKNDISTRPSYWFGFLEITGNTTHIHFDLNLSFDTVKLGLFDFQIESIHYFVRIDRVGELKHNEHLKKANMGIENKT